MKSLLRHSISAWCLILAACSAGVQSGPSTRSSQNYQAATAGTCPGNGDGNAALPGVSGANVISISVGTGLCATQGSNIPCATVKICTPGSTVNCNTISNLLVDTGSYGLRIFSSAITVAVPTQLTIGGFPLAECAYFGSNTAWGPVQTVDAYLGGEPKISNLPIQVINSSFPGSSTCNGGGTPLVTSAAATGFNGILGVGLGTIDCSYCTAAYPSIPIYVTCNGSTCTHTFTPAAQQVTNPISALSQDNNGIIFEMPSISAGGAATATGNLVFGIDTQANNASGGPAHVFYADPTYFLMRTTWAGNLYGSLSLTSESFIDSGSNFLYMPPAQQLPVNNDGSYGPTSNQCLAGVMQSGPGTGYNNQSTISFNVGNYDTLYGAVGNGAYNDVGVDQPGMFDWGMPFFYGRSIFVGITGKTSSIGTGPLWAF